MSTNTLTGPAPELVSADWTALGCSVRLVVNEPDDLAVARAILTDELAAIDRACSRFRADSELSAIVAGPHRPTPISPLLAEAIAVALEAAEATDGDVDPTVGGSMVAAGYDRDFELIATDPGPVTVVHRPAPGWRRVTLDPIARTLSLPFGLQLDLGATAKALTADRAASRISTAIEGRGALIAIGGDIAVAGESPAGGWSIRVQDITGPVEAPVAGPTQVVALTGGGLATSSTTARQWVRGGRVMHHILDPRSGVPVASPWRTVTVAAPTCVSANVASTASVVRGIDAIDWLIGRGLAARLVDVDGVVTVLPGWPEPVGALR